MSDCPRCKCETLPGANFCGRCGCKLTLPKAPAYVACRCGAGPESIDAAGFCEECGARQTAPTPGEYREEALTADLAGVTDRGRRHAVNEDAFGVARFESPAGAVSALVICDGVSTSSSPDIASAAGAAAFISEARIALEGGAGLREAAERAALAAQAAVISVPYSNDEVPPAATLIAVLACAGSAVVVWAGDSRAYLLRPVPKLLTRDDSWLNEVVESGALTLEKAKAHKYAHAIVKSLGAIESGEDFAPNILEAPLPEGAELLLCSDGLWNYAETATSLADLASKDKSALEACRDLVAFANAQGGHDNISAVLFRQGA